MTHSQNIPFVPLLVDEPKGSDVKVVLQKLIKVLPPEEYYFFSHLISTNTLYNDLDKLQKTLIQDASFSIWRLFQFFDTNGDRKLQFEDFYLTLQKLDILLKKEELYMLFKKLGGEDDDVISYAEFSELFKFSLIPKAFLKSEPSNHTLTQEQQKIVHQIFSIYMKIEKSLTQLRTQIGNLNFLQDLFFRLDADKKGYLTHIDLQRYAAAKGFVGNKRDFKRVFYRMQIQRSGRVNIEEFLKEFASPQVYMEYQQQEQPLLSQIQIQEKLHLQESQAFQKQPTFQAEPQEQGKRSILNDYLSVERRSLNQSDDSIRMPGFARYVFQDN